MFTTELLLLLGLVHGPTPAPVMPPMASSFFEYDPEQIPCVACGIHIEIPWEDRYPNLVLQAHAAPQMPDMDIEVIAGEGKDGEITMHCLYNVHGDKQLHVLKGTEEECIRRIRMGLIRQILMQLNNGHETIL